MAQCRHFHHFLMHKHIFIQIKFIVKPLIAWKAGLAQKVRKSPHIAHAEMVEA
jgi:hypothetical protein